MTEFALDAWRRANATLRAARHLVTIDPDSSASRSYYAAFHAITALFARSGQTFSKHSQLRSAVHRELVKTNNWDQHLGRAFDFLMDLRDAGDYGGVYHVTREDAERATDLATEILENVQKMENFPDVEAK